MQGHEKGQGVSGEGGHRGWQPAWAPLPLPEAPPLGGRYPQESELSAPASHPPASFLREAGWAGPLRSVWAQTTLSPGGRSLKAGTARRRRRQADRTAAAVHPNRPGVFTQLSLTLRGPSAIPGEAAIGLQMAPICTVKTRVFPGR